MNFFCAALSRLYSAMKLLNRLYLMRFFLLALIRFFLPMSRLTSDIDL